MDYTQLPFFSINRLSFSLRKELSQRFGAAGYAVSPEEWAVLLVLWSKGTQTPGTLSEQTFRDRTTVTRLVDRIVDKGFVVRSENPSDRRRSDISLAPRGIALEDELVPIAFELIAQVSAGVSVEDLETVRRTLQRLQDNLTSDTDPTEGSNQ